MNVTLLILLRIMGAGLILLAGMHGPIGRHLKWREDGRNLTPANAAIFRVHTFFICFVLVMMGLPCLLDPSIFLEKSNASSWLAWSYAAFWTTRLYVQWFVFPWHLWRGKPIETIVHVCFTVLWIFLAGVFTACGLWQINWLR